MVLPMTDDTCLVAHDRVLVSTLRIPYNSEKTQEKLLLLAYVHWSTTMVIFRYSVVEVP